MTKSSLKDSERQLKLSHFTMENLQEAVFFFIFSGDIFHANEMACNLSGYSKEELITMHVTDINPTTIVSDFGKFWQRLKEEKKITFEAQHKHKTGYLYDVEITGNYIEYNGREFSCSIVRDLRKKKMEEQLLRSVSEATSGLTGKDFLVELGKNVVKNLGLRYAFIVECTDETKTRFRTIAFVEGETVLDNIEYDVRGSACENMLKCKPYC